MNDPYIEKAGNSIIGGWERGAPFEALCGYVKDAIHEAMSLRGVVQAEHEAQSLRRQLASVTAVESALRQEKAAVDALREERG